MKTIILVRHAKAVSRDLDIPDFERSLTKKGRKEAKKVVGILKTDNIKTDLLISSPADRAIETAHLFAKELSYPIQKVVIRDILYNETSPEKIVEMIRNIDDKYSSIMIFGHNPSFEELAKLFDPKFKDNISAAAVVALKFKNKLWKTINKGKGELQFYEYPIPKAEKSQIYGNVQEQLEEKMIKQVKHILAEIDNKTTQKITDQIDQYCKKLVNKFLKSTKTYQVKRISENLPSKQENKKSTGNLKAPVKKRKTTPTQKNVAIKGKAHKTKKTIK